MPSLATHSSSLAQVFAVPRLVGPRTRPRVHCGESTSVSCGQRQARWTALTELPGPGRISHGGVATIASTESTLVSLGEALRISVVVVVPSEDSRVRLSLFGDVRVRVARLAILLVVVGVC